MRWLSPVRARLLLAASGLLAGQSQAALTLDPEFWDSYRPFQQYSPELIRELIALDEGDLLATGRDIDGLELRVVGRSAPNTALISLRAVIDSVAMRRLQAKILPFALSPNAERRPEARRRQLTAAQARELIALLEQSGFWEAEYQAEPERRAAAAACSDAGHWIVEAVRPGQYQLIARMDCGALDPLVSAIRGQLLAIAELSAEPVRRATAPP